MDQPKLECLTRALKLLNAFPDVHVMPIGVDLIVGELIEPIRAAFVADSNEHLQQIDGRTESCVDGVGIAGEASAGIHHDKRDVETFLIDGTEFALNKTVGPAVFAMVGCKYDDGVVYDALRQLVELIDAAPIC